MEEGLVCIPTTIAALERFPGFDSPQIRIILVGVVIEESIGFIFHDLTVDDSTGRISVRFVHNCSSPNDCCRLVGQYVSVAGRLSGTLPRHIWAQSVHPVPADAVSYHIIEAAHVFLTLVPRALLR